MTPGKARLGVGSGIVIDADPAREYAECLLKARFLTGFDPGFELIETMRLEAGAYRLLNLHLDRLRSSAAALGFAYPELDIAGALAEQAAQSAHSVHRVRLTLAHDGGWAVSSAILMEDAPSPRYAGIADERLDADDYLLRHKTSARSRYDTVLATLSDRPEVFDLIFFNTRGEVCEGARSSVFVERDGRLLTPPLACGLLPGVMRRYLLESGRAVECVLYREDLLGTDPVYLGNALRGLIPVSVLA
jgi:para-aminobenzoate synthetase/4-amino-4-deoxychorismate lyase